MPFLNVINFDNTKNSHSLFDEDYHSICHTLPRTIYNNHDPNKIWRSVWLFRNSVFKNWAIETENINNECFLNDWNLANIS